MGRVATVCLVLAGALLVTLPGLAAVSFGQSARLDDVYSAPGTPTPIPSGQSHVSVSIPEYSAYEISLTAAGAYANPYTDVLIAATFNGPGPTTMVVRGFWDGGQVFRVRFAPTKMGAWSYSIDSVPPDSGLTQTGTFKVVAPLEGNHGFLRRDVSYPGSFLYDDGTRHFIWGQTYYEIVRNALAGDNWKIAVDKSRAHGMNKIRMLVFPWGAEKNEYPDSQPFADPDHDLLNVPHWQKLDEIIRYLGSRGMIAELILFADTSRAFATQAQDERYLRYILARFAGYHNVIWNLTSEWNYTGKPRSYWDGIGGIIRIEDPWISRGDFLRPLTVHQQTDIDFQFFESSWPVNATVQYGVRNRVYMDGDLWGNASIRYNLGHGMPVANEEYGYIGESLPITPSQTLHRNTIWGIATAGGYGSAGDARSFDGDVPIFSANWRDSPYYDDVRRMVDFWTTRGIEYWKMSSQNSLAASDYRAYVLADPGKAYVAYAASGEPFTLELPDGSFYAEWYNPVTGVATGASPIGGGAQSFDPPFDNDAVLHVWAVPATQVLPVDSRTASDGNGGMMLIPDRRGPTSSTATSSTVPAEFFEAVPEPPSLDSPSPSPIPASLALPEPGLFSWPVPDLSLSPAPASSPLPRTAPVLETTPLPAPTSFPTAKATPPATETRTPRPAPTRTPAPPQAPPPTAIPTVILAPVPTATPPPVPTAKPSPSPKPEATAAPSPGARSEPSLAPAPSQPPKDKDKDPKPPSDTRDKK